MKNLRQQLEEVAFWEGGVCLACDATVEREPHDRECPECGAQAIVEAKRLVMWLARVEGDEE